MPVLDELHLLKRERAQESIEERANPRAKAARMRKGKDEPPVVDNSLRPGYHCPLCRLSWAPGAAPPFGFCTDCPDGTVLQEGMLGPRFQNDREDKGNGKVGKGGKDQKARSKSKGQGKGGKDEEEVVMLEDMWVLGDGIMINEQSTWSRQWQCPRCTLINEESFKVCPICDLDRATGMTVDAEAATDENAATPSERPA